MPKAGPGRTDLLVSAIPALLAFATCALSMVAGLSAATSNVNEPAPGAIVQGLAQPAAVRTPGPDAAQVRAQSAGQNAIQTHIAQAQAKTAEKKADQPAVPQPPPPTDAKEAPEPDIVQVMTREAERLKPWVSSGLARSFLGAAAELPIVTPRTLYRDAARKYYSEQAAAALPDAERGALEKVEADSGTYYTTKYGSPLAYVRAFDIVARHGFDSFSGKKVLDFGYGGVGHLALIAGLGGEAVGVDVDSFLTALYSHPDDQGVRKSATGVEGRIRLVDGHWPDGKGVGEAVGGGYDLFISKNTLKRGYIHPEKEVDPKRLVHLEVDDATFLRRVHETLKPGGLAIIYNLSPAQNPPDKPWIPWADGRCPFARDVIEKAGFEVLVYDENDDKAAREMGRLLEWDKSGMDLETSLFGHVTVFRKPVR